MAFSEEIERVRGVSGELALRRGPAGLEIVANGVFLVSAANAASSRALVGAAWPRVAGDSLDVLIGGLGIGDALDEALGCPRVAFVTVAELEPAVIAWFRRHGGAAARRAADAERAGRARLLAADVADLIDGARGMWDVVALDLSLIHITEPTRLLSISYAVFCLKKKTKDSSNTTNTDNKRHV